MIVPGLIKMEHLVDVSPNGRDEWLPPLAVMTTYGSPYCLALTLDFDGSDAIGFEMASMDAVVGENRLDALAQVAEVYCSVRTKDGISSRSSTDFSVEELESLKAGRPVYNRIGEDALRTKYALYVPGFDVSYESALSFAVETTLAVITSDGARHPLRLASSFERKPERFTAVIPSFER